MPISAAIERTLFKDKDGGGGGGETHITIIKHRFLSFLIWQFLQSTCIFFFFKTIFLSSFTAKPFTPTFLSFLSFLAIHFSLLLVSISIFFLSSPRLIPVASPIDVSLALLRLIFVPGGQNSSESRKKLRVWLSFALFVSVFAVSGALFAICICWGCDVYYLQSMSRIQRAGLVGNLGFRGFMTGLSYALHYVYKKRWVLRFPIIQRPPFFSFKMGFLVAVGQALRFSAAGYLLSGSLAFFLPAEYRSQASGRKFVVEQIISYFGSFLVIFCWELIDHLHQVLHTKRFVFAPPKGSAAAETNPSEQLLVTLEKSTPKSLLQYLAYLDLCMLCESNVDTWRRAAFFEETGGTYKRIVSACLGPMENFTKNLAEGLESSSVGNSLQLSYQLTSAPNQLVVLRLSELFYDSQLYSWCARIVASLTARSHKEDRFGVAQLSGSNTAVVSTLLSSLLAVETLIGKKTIIPSTHDLIGPAGIKWETMNSGRRESTGDTMGKIRGSPIYVKAYALADVLRTSIYLIVSAFQDEMLNSAKAGVLEKEWIISSKPLYGTHELLLHKLHLFLEFQAN
ncbi:hypothetical protein F511_04747 [Dorcoceras hygrometricum]|uniref:Nucleoporin protein Ndc1-Nup n=1 Tax=Dorcoceras hygrometricum TaxID=472368 RepID=A0A2Z7AWB2_9LAMI|nr:hypothetical protein F511_04747 [Dorcoceras hygrometricum]